MNKNYHSNLYQNFFFTLSFRSWRSRQGMSNDIQIDHSVKITNYNNHITLIRNSAWPTQYEIKRLKHIINRTLSFPWAFFYDFIYYISIKKETQSSSLSSGMFKDFSWTIKEKLMKISSTNWMNCYLNSMN